MKKLKTTVTLVGIGVFVIQFVAKAQPATEAAPEFGGWQWIWALLALSIVSLLTYWTTRLVGGKFGAASTKHLQIAENLSLGPNRQLHLILIKDQVLLLGSSEHGLTLLKEFADPAFYQELAASKPNYQMMPNNFSALLSKLLQNEAPSSSESLHGYGRIVTLQEGLEKIKSWRRTKD